jgi:hypothetical protein
MGNYMPGRSSWLRTSGLGDYEADNAEWQRLLRQLHGWALSMAQMKALIEQGGDVQQAVQQLQIDRDYFQRTLSQLKDVGRRLGQEDFTAFDRVVLSVGTYIEKVVAVLPRALTVIPRIILDAGKQLVDAIADFLAHTGGKALGLGLPLILLAVGGVALLIFGMKKAEGTRTYRKYVA